MNRINLMLQSEILTTDFSQNLDIIVSKNPSKVDVVVDLDAPEYFVWSYLNKYCDQLPEINIIKDDKI